MSEKTIAIGIALTVLAGAFLTCTAIPSVDAGTTERAMWPTDTDILVGDNNFTTKYIQVAPGEIVTVNWKSGSIPTNAYLSMTIRTGVASLNWSSDLTVNGGGFIGQWAYIDSPAKSVWFRSGGYDVVSVEFTGKQGGWWTAGKNITVNFTVTQDAYTFAPNTKDIEDKIDALQKQMDALNISSLQKAISDLQTVQGALNTEIMSLRGLLTALQTLVSQNAQSNSENLTLLESQITTLSETLKTLESVSAQNNETLTEKYTLLTEKIASITATNTTTIIDNTEVVENPYNDTALWGEVNTIKATPPVTQYNNTTQVHPTTYTTKTVSRKEEANIIPAIVAGAVSGVLTALITGVIIYVWVRRRYGVVVKAPEII